MNTNLPPYPVKSKGVNKDDSVNLDWLKWFEQLRNFVNGLLNRYDSNRSGVVAMTNGVAMVANTLVTATCFIRLTPQNNSGTPGHLRVTATPGTGFVINSTSATDGRIVFYEIVEAF